MKSANYIFLLAALLLTGLAAVPGPAAADPAASAWSMFQHDPQHTGRSPYLGPQEARVKWTSAISSTFETGPVIGTAGTIYVGCLDYNLYALNADGTTSWTYTADAQIQTCPAIGNDGTIFFGCIDGKLYAINSDGTLKWSYTTGGFIISSPVISNDNTIYVGSTDLNLYAINSDGTLKWSFASGTPVWTSPAIGSDGTIYSGGSNLYAINPDGTVKWSYAISCMYSPSIGSDGTIYAVACDLNLYAVNSDGTLKWSCTTGSAGSTTAPAIGADGTLYFGSYDNNLYAVYSNGTLKWSYATGGNIWSSPIIGSDGTIYIGSDDSILYAVNPDGTLKWSYTTNDIIRCSSAIASDGTLYVGSYDGTLYAFAGPAVQRTAVFPTTLGMVNLYLDAGSVSTSGWLPPVDVRCSSPAGYFFPYGMFPIEISRLGTGETVTVTTKFPNPLPITTRFYKCSNGSLTDISSQVTRSDEFTFLVTLTDNGPCTYGPAFAHTTTQGGSGWMSSGSNSQASLANITVKSASLSPASVAPGAPVTVTATVANSGTGNGTATVRLYINGKEESGQEVAVNSGGTSSVSFNVIRKDPGVYSVDVGGAKAGSFTVDNSSQTVILCVVGAFALILLFFTIKYFIRRRSRLD